MRSPQTDKPKLKVGDIIVSSNLQCCRYDDIDRKNNVGTGGLTLNRGRNSSPMQYYRYVNATTDDGKRIRAETKATCEMASVDASRAAAEFLVIAAFAGGGSSGHDPYPDGWSLTLKRLGKGRTFDPYGEEIHCYQYPSGCFIDSIYLKKFEVVGQLSKKVTFE